ncbi:MAG TPA: SDR family oxidoreductase [Phototrophicaceae bacterium]|nr:SDR family oxidoreductase [Phototrophicaceae bacterium]
MDRQNLILLTGGTGYVGGRLLQRLDTDGYMVRCMARRPQALQGRAGKNTEVVFGDCFDPGSLSAALAGVHTAYYLVHSMGSAGSFEEKDREAASNFAAAARAANVRRIIYLGGLGEGALSPHLRSRQEVGAALRRPGVEVIEFRASIVIGSGSLSFEIIRALVERLPVMICPAWVSVAAQPIGIEDLVNYLVEALDLPYSGHQIIEIGGADQVSYKDIMREYARQRNLRRLMISVPVLTPRLSSLWLGLVTPVYARVGRKLIDSIRNPTVVRDPIALELFSVRPKGVQDMIARAIVNEDRQFAATKWSDALSSCAELAGWGGVRFGNRIIDSREVSVDVPGDVAFLPIRQIGGKTGWYYGDWLWQVRGFVDLLMGGVGVRRGRRDSEMLQAGEAVDFWRVEAFENNKRLLLAAEMKLPGRAWLEFEVEDRGSTSLIRQTAIFDPIGVAGLLYWYLLYPVHKLMFAKMLRAIAARCRDERAVAK